MFQYLTKNFLKEEILREYFFVLLLISIFLAKEYSSFTCGNLVEFDNAFGNVAQRQATLMSDTVSR